MERTRASKFVFWGAAKVGSPISAIRRAITGSRSPRILAASDGRTLRVGDRAAFVTIPGFYGLTSVATEEEG